MKNFRPLVLAIACAGLLASSAVMSAQPGLGFPPDLGAGRSERGGHEALQGADLSEAQQQQAFAIRHAAEPRMFEQMAQVRKAHETLQALSTGAQFDEARAIAVANALGIATSALALERARVAAQIAALLTPEQRAAQARRPPMPPPQ